MLESLMHPEATRSDLSIIGEAGGLEDIGAIQPVDRGLMSEFGKGAGTGIRSFVQGTASTVGQVTGSDGVQALAEDMRLSEKYRQSWKPAPGTLNKAVHTMGQFVEDVPGLALSFAGGFGGASLAAKLGATGAKAARIIGAAQTAGIGTGVFARGFGNRKLDLMDQGVDEPWAVLGAIGSTLFETGTERLIGTDNIFADLGKRRALRHMTSIAAKEGAEKPLGTMMRALTNPMSFKGYRKIALGTLDENIEELITLYTDAGIDMALDAEGAGLPTAADVGETIYNTTLRSIIPILAAAPFSGGRNDVAAKEIEKAVSAPVTDETRAAAYTKESDRADAQAAALKARENMAEMDNQMAAFEGVLATRFPTSDAQATTRIIRTMAENLAAMDERFLPTDLLAKVKIAFEEGQVDQKKWRETLTIKDQYARARAQEKLVQDVFGDDYYDITDMAWARQKKADNDRREVEVFGDEKPEALAKRIAITTAFEQPTTRVLAQDVVDRDTYKRIFARGSVAGVKAGGGTYTVVARGSYTDEQGRTRFVRPGDLVFTQEAKAKGKKAAKAGTVELPTRLGETQRAISLDRAAAMDGGEFYDSMRRMLASGVEMQDLDDVRAEAMALVYPEETAAEKARIEAEDAAVIAQMEAEDAAFLKDELSRKGDRAKRFEERYANVKVTSTTQVGQDTKTGKPHTIKDFDELARRLAPLEKKPVVVPETPALKRDAAGLADLAKRTGIPENIVAALAKDVQVEMLSDEDYAQRVSAELLPRIQMQNAMQARAVETAGQRARTAKLNAFAQEITDRELARETAVQARALRKTKRPKARGQAERDARAESAAVGRAVREWTEAELKLVEGMSEGRFSAREAPEVLFVENGVTRTEDAEVSLQRWGSSREVYITGLKAYKPGAGMRLLRSLAQWADASGVRLIGEARAMSAEPGISQLTQEQLIRLYARYGFVSYGADSIAREPSPEGRFSAGETTPFAFYDPKTKIAHFFANAESTDVVHELFHHMTMTGIMPSWHLEALKRNYGLDTPDGDERAVDGFLRYLRTKELPKDSDPRLKDAFDHMRQVFAATMQPLAGQLNNETLAVFDTLFGFEPDGEVAEAAAALQARVLHTAEIEGGDTLSKRAEAGVEESLPEEGGRMSAREDGQYRGVHRAPTGEFGEGSLAEMNRTYPDDLYSDMGWRFYGDGNQAMDRKAHRIVVGLKDKPDAPITVYRSVPKGAASDINAGDWVTPVREYAEMHGERFGEGFDIIEKQVLAGELFTEGNSLFEFGWQPKGGEGRFSVRDFYPDQTAAELQEMADWNASEVARLTAERTALEAAGDMAGANALSMSLRMAQTGMQSARFGAEVKPVVEAYNRLLPKHGAQEGIAEQAEARGNKLVYRMVRNTEEALDILKAVESGNYSEGFRTATIVDGHALQNKGAKYDRAVKQGRIPVFTSPYPTVSKLYDEGAGLLVAIEYSPDAEIYVSSRAGSTQGAAYSATFADSEHIIDAKGIVNVSLVSPEQEDTIQAATRFFEQQSSRGAFANTYKDKDSELTGVNLEETRNLRPIKKSLGRAFTETPVSLPNGLEIMKGQRVRFKNGAVGTLSGYRKGQAPVGPYEYASVTGYKGEYPALPQATLDMIDERVAEIPQDRIDKYYEGSRDVARQESIRVQQEGYKSNVPVADIEAVWDKSTKKWVTASESGRFSARQDRLGFYSAAERAVEGLKQETFAPAQLKSVVAKTPGVKAQELEETGFNDWLDGIDGKVTKAQALAFLENNGPRLTEVVKGATPGFAILDRATGEVLDNGLTQEAAESIAADNPDWEIVQSDLPAMSGDTKFGQLQLPGGTNYREVLLTLPWKESDGTESLGKEGQYEVFMDGEFMHRTHSRESAERDVAAFRNNPANQGHTFEARPTRIWTGLQKTAFASSHWNEPNVLAHMRLNDRIGPDGEKILFIEEIQSDALQKLRALQEKLAKGESLTDTEQQEYKTLSNFPFKGSKSWAMLAFKRVLRMAAEQGYDSVAWTDGETQAQRYPDALRQVADEIGWNSDEGVKEVTVFKDGVTKMSFVVDSETGLVRDATVPQAEGKPVADVLGKDMAAKVAAEDGGSILGEEFTMGAEGMKGFYDRILPSEVGKYVGKIDKAATVGQSKLAPSGATASADTDDFVNWILAHHIEISALSDAEYTRLEKEFEATASGVKVWSLPITDALRSSVMEGQGRFSARPISSAPADDDKAYGASRRKLVGTHAARMQIPPADALQHLRSLATKRYPHIAGGDPEKTLRLLSKAEWREFYQDVRKAEDIEYAARLDRRAIAEFGMPFNSKDMSPANRTLVSSLDYAKTQSIFKKPSLQNPTREAIKAVAGSLASQMEQEVELKENARMASVPAYHGSEGAGTAQNLLRSFWHSAKKFRRGVFNRILLQTRDIQTLAVLLADNNPDSVFMQLSADIRESDNRKVEQGNKSLGYLGAAMKKRGIDSFAKHMARPVVVGGQAMSFEEALAIAMFSRGDVSRNEAGEYSYRQADALFQSNGKDYVGEGGRDAFDAFILDAWKVVNADKNVKATMEVMDEYFELIKKDINASRAERGEEPMGDQSGYFPMIREGGMFANEDAFADTIGISPAKVVQSTPVDARTRARGQAYGGRLRMNVETVFNEYRRQADQYIAKETTIQMWKAALDQSRTAFADKGLTDELEMVYSHLESERHYTGRYTPLSADEIVVRAVSSKYKQSIFGLNIPASMLQPLGALNVNSILPIMDAWRAPVNVMSMVRHAAFNMGRNFPNVLKGNKYWDMMVAGNSKHSASEYTAIETGIQKGTAGYFDPSIKGVPLKDVMLLPMRHGDMIGRAAAWGAAYESQMRQLRHAPGMTDKQKHDKSFKFAEDAVEETQAAGMMSGRTWMQKSNEYLKAIVPFTSQQSKDWNILATRLLNPMQKAWKAGEARGGTMGALNEVWEVVAGTEHARRQYGIHRGAGQVLAFSYVVPAMMMAALSRGRPPEDFEEFLADLFAYNVAILPIIGPTVRASIVAGRFFDQQPIYFKLLSETGKAVRAAKERDGEEFTWAAVRTTAMATGLPLKAAKVFEKTLKDQFTDQYDEFDARKFFTYSLLGYEALQEIEAEEKGAK
jgi:hypothetical protein